MTFLEENTKTEVQQTRRGAPLVSVVIPMYNAAAYLQDCLDSVLAQTYKNIEVIAVDDGSPDHCADIIRACDDPRVTLVQQRNRGLAGARNTGICRASGDYIAFLDSDDMWRPEKLEMHVAHLRANPSVGVSYSASQFMDEGGQAMSIGQTPKCESVTAVDIFCRNPVGNGSAPVIRRETLKAIEFICPEQGHYGAMYFDESFRQSEDVECWLRIALSTDWEFAGIDEPLTLYRVNGEGLSANWQNQLASWERSVECNRRIDAKFIARWESLARAYQYRYLARRAVQSRDAASARKLLTLAYRSDLRILPNEFGRTVVTTGCTVLLNCLPTQFYSALEERVMAVAA